MLSEKQHYIEKQNIWRDTDKGHTYDNVQFSHSNRGDESVDSFNLLNVKNFHTILMISNLKSII